MRHHARPFSVYEGEYSFAPHPLGTEVTYRIRNIFGHPGLIIRLWQRRMLTAQQRDLDKYVAALPRPPWLTGW